MSILKGTYSSVSPFESSTSYGHAAQRLGEGPQPRHEVPAQVGVHHTGRGTVAEEATFEGQALRTHRGPSRGHESQRRNLYEPIPKTPEMTLSIDS